MQMWPQVVSDARAEVSPQPRRAYLGHALTHPGSLLTFLAGLGLVYVGSLVAAGLMMSVAICVAWTLSSSREFRRSIDEYVARQRRIERRNGREELLEQAGVPREPLTELTALVEDIERRDGGRISRRFELEEILDHWVQLAIARERCVRALRMADRAQLVRALAEEPIVETRTSRRRRELLERRIRCWDQCKRDADRCAEELSAISELIRLLAQEAARPDLVLDDDEIDRRLRDLDDEQSALRELAEPSELRLLAGGGR